MWLLICLSALAQDPQVAGITDAQSHNGGIVEANYTGFPSANKMSPELWKQVNPGQPYNERACYKTFGKDPVKFAEVIGKCNAFESFYINPDKPSTYRIVKGLYPINFQRNGEWIPLNSQLRQTGNNVYEAPDQWNPVGIQVKDHKTWISAPAKVQFNDWTLYGINGTNKTELAKANWSNYTVGADGIKIINIFPGIDAEMRVSRGGIKTSFVIHQFNYTQYSELYFEDAFIGLTEKGLFFQNGDNEKDRAEAVYADVTGEPSAIKIAPAFGFAKKNPGFVTSFPYHVSGNKIGVAVPAEFIVNNLATGDVVIDPLVQSTNSIAQSAVGTMYNASCGWANHCDYIIAVTPPANATITSIASEIYVVANAPCGLEQFAVQMQSGTCYSPGAGQVWRDGSATGPGTMWAGYYAFPGLMGCAPAPSCTPSPMSITYKLFRKCAGPVGCDNTCIGLVNPLSVMIEGHTAELTTINVSAASACQNQDITFSTSTANGVGPFSAINWSYNASGTPSLGTGPSINAGAALAPGAYTIYADATDACGTSAQVSKSFTIKPLPVATLGSAGITICNRATTNITPSSTIGGTTYTWTVVQTNVTGASNGSGTTIAQQLTNNGGIPGTAVYTITPKANGCDGSPIIYTVTVQPANNILYVDDLNGNDANCGDAWTSSLKTLSTAMDIAKYSNNVQEIWVAKGTYYPTGAQNGVKRDSSFTILRGGLKLYGGYPNGGGVRDVAANATVLSGDIGTLNDTLDNSYHVMVIGGIFAGVDSIVVDGFTLTKGNADGTGTVSYGTAPVYQGHGGGLYVKNNAQGQKTALRNLTFTANTSKILAGGLEMDISSPLIENCTFTNNHCMAYGGAMACDNQASPVVTGCNFTGNTAYSLGGAVFTQNNTSTPVFTNCSFIANNAVPYPPGTGYTYGGAMFNNTGSNTTLTNCIFTANRATGGGGAICGSSSAVATITYSVFDGNVCVNALGDIGSGGALQMMGGGGVINLNNSVLANNIAGGANDDGGGALMAYTGIFNCANVTLSGNTTQSTIKTNSNGISIYSGSTVNFYNSIAWGTPAQQLNNQGTFNNDHSLVKGTAPALPNLDLDPQFVDAANTAGADGIWRTADDGLQLTPCSPAANMGSNALVPGSITTDMAGNARIFNTTVDMGAYELQAPLTPMSFTNVVKTYGDPDAAVPNITNCSGLPVTFTIADNTIATMVSGNLHILKAGVTTITAHTVNGTPDVTVTLTVNPKPVTISLTATPVTKVYDGNTTATINAANLQFAAGDIVGADNVVITLSSNNALYDTKDVGTGKTITVPLANISLTGTAAANYIISNTSDISAAVGVITPLAITITADAKTKTYGNADPALTYTNLPALAPGDAFTGALTRAPGENVGTYAINQGTLALSSNYTITYIGNNLTITQKTITVTADAKTKVYGNADPALTYTYAPALVGTDAFTGSLSRTAGENVGTYAINQGTLALSANYTIVYTGSNLTITKKAITVTVDAKTKTYGDADPALTYMYAPALVGTDVFTGSLLRIAGENVGVYTINQGSLTLSGNYLITFNGNSLTITPKTITATADAQTKIYGDPDPALTYKYTPALVGTDVFVGAIGRTPGENAGSYTINQSTLALSSNYILIYVPANLIINKAVLTVTARDTTICLRDVLTAGTINYSGFKNGDDANDLTRQPTVAIPNYTAAGNYTLTPSGGSSNNYSFNYVSAQLTVKPVPSGAITQTQLGPAVITTPGFTSGVQLTAPTAPGYTYAWSTGETASSIAVKATGDFWVTVTNSQGCSTRFTAAVFQQTLVVPNIFSPNGDNIHDKWVIENLQNYPGNVVQIYNRYGQVVFKMTNYTPWDGRVNGKDMPVGTYYYIIDPKNGQKPVTGYIDIIR
ncbi:hypothetical protein A3860_12760 [Niastella vici]|uniref:PKD domain-containing protein n=2 Tax=Niastella vici TaxID=1703345 RepID=A0A1V9G7B3_9BACT|nr:hypothetical protein A3860_12760 [Niastella vici]